MTYNVQVPCQKKVVDFGRQLKRWLYSEKGAWPIIPTAYASWVSGGCWVLARALQYWIGQDAELLAIYSWPEIPGDDDEKMPQHVVVRIGGYGGCYLDGDGASTEKALLSRWVNEEGLIEPEISTFIPEELDAYEIQCPVGPMKDLARALYRRFGDPSEIF